MFARHLCGSIDADVVIIGGDVDFNSPFQSFCVVILECVKNVKVLVHSFRIKSFGAPMRVDVAVGLKSQNAQKVAQAFVFTAVNVGKVQLVIRIREVFYGNFAAVFDLFKG